MPQFTDGFAILNVDPGALKGRLDSPQACICFKTDRG